MHATLLQMLLLHALLYIPQQPVHTRGVTYLNVFSRRGISTITTEASRKFRLVARFAIRNGVPAASQVGANPRKELLVSAGFVSVFLLTYDLVYVYVFVYSTRCIYSSSVVDIK